MKIKNMTAGFILWVKNFFREDRPKLKRDIYYMSMAFTVAQRSIDPHTIHGAIIVAKDGRILSTGYNGPIKNCYDHEVPLTRPEKYKHFLHAEENAVINYHGSSQDIEGSTIYITGLPCSHCLRMALQKGITHVVFAPIVSKMIDKEDIEARDLMLQYQMQDIEFRKMSMKQMGAVIENLHGSIKYIEYKLGMRK